jgi:hypothetical protein
MAASDVYLDAGMRGWIVGMARQEQWRAPKWYSLEDLIQDGYMCYCRCRERYTCLTVLNHPGKDQRKHFMALVKSTFINHIMTLATKYTSQPEDIVSQMGGEAGVSLEALAPTQAEDAPLVVALKQAPAELMELIGTLVKDGAEVGSYVRSRLRTEAPFAVVSSGPGGCVKSCGYVPRVRRGRRALRETTNDYLDRSYGRPDVTKVISDYILT